MNTQEQIKALAELDGWRFVRVNKGSYNEAGFKVFLNDTGKGMLNDYQGFECVHDVFRVPRYLSSYDAIIPLCFPYWGDWFTKAFSEKATPSQLAEALLRATGKWKE